MGALGSFRDCMKWLTDCLAAEMVFTFGFNFIDRMNTSSWPSSREGSSSSEDCDENRP